MHGIRTVNTPTFEALQVASRPPSGATALDGSDRLSPAAASPPRRGASLARRLALLTTLVVTGTMAAMSGTQLWFDLRVDRMEHEKRLRESLAPLVAELESARTWVEAHEALRDFHIAYANQGYTDHHLSVMDGAGRSLISTAPSVGRSSRGRLTGRVPVVAPVLGAGSHMLVVAANSAGIVAARERRWRDWALHVGVTAMLTLGLLSFVIRREVIRPIDNLLEGIRKMELGYWDDVPDPGGAWEIRWLGWRFRVLGQELNSTVENLVAAQRRAFTMDPGHTASHEESGAGVAGGSGALVLHAEAVLARLQGRLARLRCASPTVDGDRVLAQLVWGREAPVAERLGRPDLSADLEDAALKILEPAGFAEVCAAIDRARPALHAFAQERKLEIARAAALRGVRLIEVQWRIKHAAGVWRKMQLKGLRLEQVYDLVALRLIVPAKADCYHALGVVHDLYRPVVGRFKDYIAAPKSNGYQSLHCSVRGMDGSMFEVQVRSSAMHRHAENGGSCHSRYRASARLPQSFQTVSPWRRIRSVVRGWRQGDRRGA